MLYLLKSLDELPEGIEFRVLGECPYWENKLLVETKIELALEKAPEFFPNGVPTNPDGCIEDWSIKANG